ncbi:MAG: hypothetical protein LQ348_003082 [Seirophora lacunosa]|nr:MAG: hypothetical protein LQ348_003082 [Seirophora lacunosa]
MIEGQIVSRVSVSDVESTAATFTMSPLWQIQLGRQVASPLYKTEDLVRCDVETGSLELLRRKDNQVRLRGQRLELGEVERHLQFAYPEAWDILVVSRHLWQQFSVGSLGGIYRPDFGTWNPRKVDGHFAIAFIEEFQSEVRAADHGPQVRTNIHDSLNGPRYGLQSVDDEW